MQEFLNLTVPDELRRLTNDHVFFVVGTRALNLYLRDAQLQPLSTVDWDILYVGSPKEQYGFTKKIISRLKTQGFSIQADYHEPSSGDSDIFDFRGRSWVRLSTVLSGAKIPFLDVYRVSEILPADTETFVRQEGLLYSDLGFLTRELNRSEENAKAVISMGSNLSSCALRRKLAETNQALDDNALELALLEQELEDIEELGEGDLALLVQEQLGKLDQAKHTLMRVSQERDALFGLLLSGRASKPMTAQICQVCRDLELSYEKYQGLRAHCSSIRKLC